MRRLSILVVAWLWLLAGCVNLQRSYPDKHFFALDVNEPVKTAGGPGRRTLQIADVRISPRYSGKNFVYRLSDTSYETDFYNEFLVPPAALIAEELAKGLRRSGVFQYVVDSASEIHPDYVMKAAINSLYGDFRNAASPKAVLEMQIFVATSTGGGSDIVLQKNYSASVPLDAHSPDALVRGWDRGLESILSELAADLERLQSAVTEPGVSGTDKSGAAATR
jgi:cholesterol transport system auxiliary component